MIVEVYPEELIVYCQARSLTISMREPSISAEPIRVKSVNLYLSPPLSLVSSESFLNVEVRDYLKLECEGCILELYLESIGGLSCVLWEPRKLRVRVGVKECRGLEVSNNKLIVDVKSGTLLVEGENLHTLHLEGKWFNLIRSKLKKVEGRLYDEKRRTIKIGDYICFISNNRKAYSVVKELRVYNDFRELIVDVGLENILPGVKSLDEGLKVYRNYYSEREERKYGVLAIFFELV